MLIFFARLVLGLAIAAASCVAGAHWPAYAWGLGWVGGCIYFAVVVIPKGWDA